MGIKPHSRHLIHVGVNFLVTPAPAISPPALLAFQQALFSEGLEFQKVENTGSQLLVVRERPSPLHISIVTNTGSPVGQILIIGPNLTTGLDYFIQDAEAALRAFETVWTMQNRQMIQGDATIRDLYETTSQHAFQELWESRLGQSSQALAAFGRPIRGGGLRFVMDPLPGESEPVQIEVKIESFLTDASKIFLETQFTWRNASGQPVQFNVHDRLKLMDEYIKNPIQAFITGGAPS
jgi:hypothetical protein